MNLAGLKAVMMDIRLVTSLDQYKWAVILEFEAPGNLPLYRVIWCADERTANETMAEELKNCPQGCKLTATTSMLKYRGESIS